MVYPVFSARFAFRTALEGERLFAVDDTGQVLFATFPLVFWIYYHVTSPPSKWVQGWDSDPRRTAYETALEPLQSTLQCQNFTTSLYSFVACGLMSFDLSQYTVAGNTTPFLGSMIPHS